MDGQDVQDENSEKSAILCILYIHVNSYPSMLRYFEIALVGVCLRMNIRAPAENGNRSAALTDTANWQWPQNHAISPQYRSCQPTHRDYAPMLIG